MNLIDTVQENVAVALTTLRTSKMRSALTILGVVIGISTVMAMATIVSGIQQQIVRTIEIAGPTDDPPDVRDTIAAFGNEHFRRFPATRLPLASAFSSTWA